MKMENEKLMLRGELALMAAIVINSFSVVLMLYSGSGISAISSVPYAFKDLSLGTWTYIFQGALVLSLMILRRKFVPSYLFSFVAGFAFSELLDVNELWIGILPQTIPCRIVYFLISYFLLSIGIALENRCQLPIIPTDLFPRELSAIIKRPYARVKITFDVLCLATTGLLTGLMLGYLEGLGIGTIVAAFTMGKMVSITGSWIDQRVTFASFLSKQTI
jgi:uncharacterized membrane protein YczE